MLPEFFPWAAQRWGRDGPGFHQQTGEQTSKQICSNFSANQSALILTFFEEVEHADPVIAANLIYI